MSKDLQDFKHADRELNLDLAVRFNIKIKKSRIFTDPANLQR